jgi:hypothetical protein
MSLFMGAVEKAPPVDEETEALFIEDPEAEPEEDDELFLDDELPLIEEDPLPDMSLDNLAETNTAGPAAPAQPPASGGPGQSEPEAPGIPDYPQYPDFSDYPQQPSQPETPRQEQTPPQPEQAPRSEQPPQQAPQSGPQPQPEPPQYPQPPQYPPGDEPEALPIEEPEEELTLEDGGEENPQDWAEPEAEAPSEEQSLPEDEDVPGESLPEDQAAGDGEAVENEFGEEEPEDVFADEIPEGEQQADPEELFPEDSEEPQEESPRESSAPAASQPDAFQDASVPDAEPKLTKDSVLGLVKYLKDMSGSLPDKKREDFMQSDARVSMEYVINTLEGKKGLFEEIKKKVPSAVPAKPRALSIPAVPDKEKIAGTLSYLGNLSTSIQDKNLFAALRKKVQNIMARIKAVTDKRQKNG